MLGRHAPGRSLAAIAVLVAAVSGCTSASTPTTTVPPATVPASFDVSLLDDEVIERTRGIIEEGRRVIETGWGPTPVPGEVLGEIMSVHGMWRAAAVFSAPEELEPLYRQQASNYEAIQYGARIRNDFGCDVGNEPCTTTTMIDWQGALADAERIDNLLLALFEEYESR